MGLEDIQAAENSNLVTIPDVEIVSTGTYDLFQPGKITFNTDQLAAAVAAQDDPAIHAPRLKIGHTTDFGDGEPSFGKILNMRLSNEGHTIVGDYVGVPKWLAEVMPTAYPSRSMEGGIDVETPTGRTHDMVIEAVALLGVIAPGVAVIDDLKELYGEEAPEGLKVEATRQPKIMAKVHVEASVDQDDVRHQYYDTLTADQQWWWIRELFLDPTLLIVDDDEGHLFAVGYEINGEELTFTDPEEVEVQYAKVGSGEVAAGKQPTATFASRSESRPETEKEEQMDPKEIRKLLGLPEDATDEQVKEKLEAVGESTEPPAGEPGESETETPAEETTPDDPPPEETPPGEETETETETATPEGAVPVDASALADLQRRAKMGEEAREQQLKSEENADIEAAIKAGKFPRSSEKHYRKLYAADREGTKKLLAELEPGLIPVDGEELGEGGTGEEVAASQTSYPKHWLSPGERARVEAGGKDPDRTTQEAVI